MGNRWTATVMMIGALLSVPTSCTKAEQAKPKSTVAATWKPGTTLSYVLYRGKVEAGVSWGRYVGPVRRGPETLYRFETRVRIDPAKLGVSRMPVTTEQGTLDTDERGRPRRFQLRTGLGQTSDLTFEGNRFRGTAGGRKTAGTTQPGAFLLANNHVVHEVLALSLVRPKAPTTTLRFFSANARRVLDVTYERKGSGATATLQNSLGERIRLGTNGLVSTIGIPAQALRFEREERNAPKTVAQREPLRYRRPANATWRDQAIRVKALGTTLAGTLSVPRSGSARKPAVLFISGSGSQDRHGFAAAFDLGTWEILDALAARRFVVLRLDDRGAGGSSPGRVPGGIGYQTLVDDARRALAFLAGRAEVDPRNLFLIGHSEGALTAAILASEKRPIRGVVLMAGPGRSLLHVIRAQNEALVWHRLSPEARAKQRRTFEEMIAAIKERRAPDPKLIPPARWAQAKGMSRWLREHMEISVPKVLAHLRQPVLVAQGGKDFQVSVQRDAKVAARLIRAGGNRDVTLAVFPNLDHLFKPEPGVSSLNSYLDRSRRVDRGFLGKLIGWLKDRIRR